MQDTRASVVVVPRRARLSTFQQFTLSFFWFAVSVHWTALLIVLMPSQVLALVGDAAKGRGLGITLLFGAFVSMVVAPIFGAMSDRSRFRMGRRRPYMIVGTLINCVALAGMAVAPSLAVYILVFLVVEAANNLATAPYSAMIPDLVPDDQRGAASGWMGLMTMLGNLVGGLIGLGLGLLGGITGAYAFLIVVMLIGMAVTVLFVQEEPIEDAPPFRWGHFLRTLFDPLRSHDFRWVFLTRLLVMMGIYTVQEFLQFYFKDVIGAPFVIAGVTVAETPEAAVSFFILPLLLGALASSLAAGMLSDRYGRKLLVYASGGLMGLVALVFILTTDFALAAAMGLVFGLGYGAYTAVDWALATDVLPSIDDFAKDMGVWHIAIVLPQVVATPIAGFLLDHFQVVGRQMGQPNLGYTVIFLVAVGYFVLGTVFVRRIRGAR